MIDRDQLTNFIYDTLGRDLLAKAAKVDNVPNSVQIKGKKDINKIVVGVSASPEFIRQAVKANADYAIVHHGLHTGYIVNGRFDAYEERLRLIFQNDLTLAGFHYALDAHSTLGNNAQIIKKLGANRLEEPYFDEWGWVGEFSKTAHIDELSKRCAELFHHDVFAITTGPQKIKRIGVCSGGAVPRENELFEILDKKIDLHLTGEVKESAPYIAEEGKYNYFACGHYATEIFGVQALAGEIKKEFGNKIDIEFLDIPTDL